MVSSPKDADESGRMITSLGPSGVFTLHVPARLGRRDWASAGGKEKLRITAAIAGIETGRMS
jgi:hypothetical protein